VSRPKKRVEEQRNKDQIRNSGRSFSGEAYKAENVKKETKKPQESSDMINRIRV